MRKILLPIALGALTLAACETTSAPSPAAAGFDRGDFTWSAGRGSGRVQGRLAYTARGSTFSCQATGVVLTPETPWVRQRMQTLYRNTERAAAPVADVRERMPKGSPDYDAYVRKAPCDAQSRYSFAGLPDGAWYLITSGQPSGAGQPMAFMRRVVIKDGGAVVADL